MAYQNRNGSARWPSRANRIVMTPRTAGGLGGDMKAGEIYFWADTPTGGVRVQLDEPTGNCVLHEVGKYSGQVLGKGLVMLPVASMGFGLIGSGGFGALVQRGEGDDAPPPSAWTANGWVFSISPRQEGILEEAGG